MVWWDRFYASLVLRWKGRQVMLGRPQPPPVPTGRVDGDAAPSGRSRDSRHGDYDQAERTVVSARLDMAFINSELRALEGKLGLPPGGPAKTPREDWPQC